MKIMANTNGKKPMVGNYVDLFWYGVSGKRYHQVARISRVENIKNHSFPVTDSYRIGYIGKNGIEGIAFIR